MTIFFQMRCDLWLDPSQPDRHREFVLLIHDHQLASILKLHLHIARNISLYDISVVSLKNISWMIPWSVYMFVQILLCWLCSSGSEEAIWSGVHILTHTPTRTHVRAGFLPCAISCDWLTLLYFLWTQRGKRCRTACSVCRSLLTLLRGVLKLCRLFPRSWEQEERRWHI